MLGFTGIRWGELVRLETEYVRPAGVRVEWQLYELNNGQLDRSPPNDESRRTVAAPAWLVELISDHIRRTSPGSARVMDCATCSPAIVPRTAPPALRVRGWRTWPSVPRWQSAPSRPS
jgi:hypothetical protein